MAYTLSFAPAASRPTSFFSKLNLFSSVARERAALAKLDASALADLGLTAEQVAAEVDRAPWDVPAHWVHQGRKA